MTSTYAAGTTVSVERSKAELDTLLGKHGAGKRAIMHDEDEGTAGVLFELAGRQYKIVVPMPQLADFAGEPKSQPRRWPYWSHEQREDWRRAACEQACRERWRGLVLLVKAKLEIVRMGVSTFEREFLADLVLPNGRTAHHTLDEYMRNLLADGYRGPPQLPGVKDSAMKRCAQCWREKPLAAFCGQRGGTVQRCDECRGRYGKWSTLSLEEKLAARPAPSRPRPLGRVTFTNRSGNRKLGPLPSSISERGACPPSCGLYDAGCYAEYGMLGAHWRRVGDRGLTWEQFLARVRALPDGQLWRHNEAGDLAGEGATLNRDALDELVEANRGRRGFTFTHKHAPEHYELLQWANLEGFTINLSADTLEEADALFQDDDPILTKAGPVAVLLPANAPKRLRTPGGRYVVTCVAQTTPGVTCAACKLCAKPFRHSIVGFRAHGQFKKHVPELVQLRRKAVAA